MIAAWACSTKTFVRTVDDNGVQRIFPPDPLLPEWQAVAAAVKAGMLVITDFTPPPALAAPPTT